MTLKKQRQINAQIREQQEKEKSKQQREILRKMHEQLRRKKQQQLLDIGQMIQPNEPPMSVIGDPKNSQAIRNHQQLNR